MTFTASVLLLAFLTASDYKFCQISGKNLVKIDGSYFPLRSEADKQNVYGEDIAFLLESSCERYISAVGFTDKNGEIHSYEFFSKSLLSEQLSRIAYDLGRDGGSGISSLAMNGDIDLGNDDKYVYIECPNSFSVQTFDDFKACFTNQTVNVDYLNPPREGYPLSYTNFINTAYSNQRKLVRICAVADAVSSPSIISEWAKSGAFLVSGHREESDNFFDLSVSPPVPSCGSESYSTSMQYKENSILFHYSKDIATAEYSSVVAKNSWRCELLDFTSNEIGNFGFRHVLGVESASLVLGIYYHESCDIDDYKDMSGNGQHFVTTHYGFLVQKKSPVQQSHIVAISSTALNSLLSRWRGHYGSVGFFPNYSALKQSTVIDTMYTWKRRCNCEMRVFPIGLIIEFRKHTKWWD